MMSEPSGAIVLRVDIGYGPRDDLDFLSCLQFRTPLVSIEGEGLAITTDFTGQETLTDRTET